MTLLKHYEKLLHAFHAAKDDETAAIALERSNFLAEVIITSEGAMGQKLAVMIGYCSGLDHASTIKALRDLQRYA